MFHLVRGSVYLLVVLGTSFRFLYTGLMTIFTYIVFIFTYIYIYIYMMMYVVLHLSLYVLFLFSLYIHVTYCMQAFISISH